MDLLDQPGHLVGNESDVRVRFGEDGQTRAIPGRDDKEEALFEFHHRLHDSSGLEVLPATFGKAVEARSDSGEALTSVALEFV